MSEQTTDRQPLTLEQLIIHLGKRVARIEEVAMMLLEHFKPAPEFQRSIAEYSTFDWSKIGARVVAKDEWGATIVEWNGKLWKRRSMDNKYGANIWFARCIGKDGEENKYAWLINFSDKQLDMSVEPLREKAKAALLAAQQRRRAA